VDADIDARNRGNASARIVAAAKLVAAWPEGNDGSCGAGTSVFGSRYREDGRSRSTRALIPVADQSASATAIRVSQSGPHRR
jgi:hypothetical protein